MTVAEDGLPIKRPPCAYCEANNIEGSEASVEDFVAFNGHGAVVLLCKPHHLTAKGLGNLVKLGRPATREDLIRFGLLIEPVSEPPPKPDFQVSGDEEEWVQDEAPAAVQAAVETPALFPASKTAPKALEAPKQRPEPIPGRTPRHELPPGADPAEWVRCPDHPERGWLLRRSWNSHVTNMHKGSVAHQVRHEPELAYRCPAREQHGCYANFADEDGLTRHLDRGHSWVTADV